MSQLNSNVHSRFRGTLAGGLIGDCLGSPFEGDPIIPKAGLQKFISKQLEEQSEKCESPSHCLLLGPTFSLSN